MITYKRAVDQAGAGFSGHIVEWVDRRKNEEADALDRLGSKRLPPPLGVFLDILTHLSVRVPWEIGIAEPPTPNSVLVAVVSDVGDWTEPYMNYVERHPANGRDRGTHARAPLQVLHHHQQRALQAQHL
jgi:hypothetical protein